MASEETKNVPFETLVLGPGGAKGYLHLGALALLHKHRLLSHVKNYIGVSIGAIVSLLLVCGYSPIDIITIAIKIDLFSSLSLMRVWNNLKKRMGLLSIHPMRHILEKLVQRKFKTVPTLEELYHHTGLTFTIVTNNISKSHGAEYLNYKNSPKLSCVEAVIMSANVPFLFLNYKYQDGLYIDGATVNPYPVDITPGDRSVLGLYLDNEDEKQSSSSASAYLFRVIQSPIREIYRRNREQAKHAHHLCLLGKTHDTLGISLTIQERALMILDGYGQAYDYVKEKGLLT